MPSPTLFPLDRPLVLAVDRPAPVLWLRRLVIVSALDAPMPIREISFRRGLNIIQTRQRTAGETHIVGHSVGKTLLMRLIRYTLGEQHFAVSNVRSRIAGLFPTAQVITHWKVLEQDWIVVRPLQEGRSSKSFAVRADDWRTAIQEGQTHLSFADFLTAVSESALSTLAEFTLARARRAPKWLDVLGWLARDYECGYRAPNEWRHEDADSGTGLDRDDNSLILQWMADLMGTEEIALKKNHQQLLDQRQDAKAKRDAAQKTVDVTGPGLLTKLELTGAEAVGNQEDGLFAIRIVETADDKIASLKRLKEERVEQSSLSALEAAEEAAKESLIAAEAEVRSVIKQIELLNARIEKLDKADSPTLYALRSPYEGCPSEQCPMKLENRPIPQGDPAKEHNLAQVREELEQYQQELPEKETHRDSQKTAYANAEGARKAENGRVAGETSGIDQDIGRWQSYVTDARSYSSARNTVQETSATIESLDRQITESYQVQETVREGNQARLNRFSECYAQILKEVFGGSADGKIALDGRGLHPAPDHRLAPNGAALSIMTTVLAFDLSMLAASIEGNGSHPRLLIHDSPREGDMEEPLFHQLFRVARSLELLFGGEEPSFQYIVTTTTSPPPELADEAGPFVRLTLDARKPEEHLLGISF